MIVHFIRHGKTKGNEEKRYIGRTDEALSPAGIQEIAAHVQIGYPKADFIIHSGMKRTLQTAQLIYGQDIPMVGNLQLRECDFGRFEGKNYRELSGDDDYQRWIDSNGTMPFPEGEDIREFKKRCLAGFLDCIHRYRQYEQITFCVHGGTIMAVLSQLADDAVCNVPSGKGKTYYDYHCDNAACLSYKVMFSDHVLLSAI